MIILSRCDNHDQRISQLETAVLDQCRLDRVDCLSIPHLYHIADSSRLWENLAPRFDDAILLCSIHPRAAHWLLAHHQIDCDEARILNLNAFTDADAVLFALAKLVKKQSSNNKISKQTADKKKTDKKKKSALESEALNEEITPRWYPVIDTSRCVNCQHCHQFCLFGVYELNTDGIVQVCNPDLCKPGCPACSRICPQSAIMFPLYEKDEAIAGAPDRFVAVDPAARRMFYTRTKQPCPVCGRKAERKSSTPVAGEKLCPECGRPEPAKKTAKAPASQPFDDLDKLVDQLDQAMQSKRK